MQLYRIIEFACTQMKKANEICLKAANALEDPGLKTLLLSLVEREKENAARLGETDGTFSFEDRERDFPIYPDAYATKSAGSPPSDKKNLLLWLIEQKQKMAGLYRALSENCPDGEEKYFFQKLYDDEMKQHSWVKDRYDLVALR